MRKFILNMLSSESDVSSKRFNATICIQSMAIAALVIIFTGTDITDNHISLMSMIFGGGVILLGVNAAEKIFRK